MKILSHRGYWKAAPEKNTETAFVRSFSMGYGTETDVRDCGGRLLISHDMPAGNEIEFPALLDMADQEREKAGLQSLPLALNVKADGMANAMRPLLDRHPLLDAFVFDMSVPDMRAYFEAGIPVFTRMSEVEQAPAWLDRSSGVWLDSFVPEWYENKVISELLKTGKRVCVVSSELHKRDHKALWQQLLPLVDEDGLMLCTDLPEDASSFFGIAGGGH